MKHQIILASGSPRRKELLKTIVNKFKVIASNIDESRIKAGSPIGFAKKAALLKAKAVAKKHKKSIVIGADTIVVLGKKILGKPKNSQDAFKMLKSLSGTTHKVITGLTVIAPGQKIITKAVVTKIKMKKVPLKYINEYVVSGGPLDKAGGYGIQEIEELFIKEIDGDYDNVVGLPVLCLKQILDQLI